jgi:hypothetical protein
VLNVDPHGVLYRLVAVLAGLVLICLGLSALLRGESSYANWFGGLVFAPLAVLFGVFILSCAIFKPDWLATKAVERRRRRRF